jgi:mannose-6-phosphate isomerase-like protein (cupin superfamily)
MTITAGKVVSYHETPPVRWLGEEGRFLLRSEDTNGQYTFMAVSTQPGGGPPLHIHAAEDETFFVLAGRYAIQLGDTVLEAGVGDLVYGPRGVPHKFRNIAKSPSKLLVIATPGGVEKFFEGLSELVTGGGPPDPERMVALATEHRIRGLEPVPPGPAGPGPRP